MLVQLGNLICLRASVSRRRVLLLLHIEVVFKVGDADFAHTITYVIKVHSFRSEMLRCDPSIKLTAATR